MTVEFQWEFYLQPVSLWHDANLICLSATAVLHLKGVGLTPKYQRIPVTDDDRRVS